jgi:hypothetical protein
MTFGANTTFFYTWGTNEGIQINTPIHNEKCAFLRLVMLTFRALAYKFGDVIGGIYLPHNDDEVAIHAINILRRGELVIWHNRNFENLQKKLPKGCKAALQHTRLANPYIISLD